MEKLVEMTFEIEQDVYDEASRVCKQLGTTIEIMAESFIRFCVIPENLPLLEAYINAEKEPVSADTKAEIDQRVFEKVFAIATKETEIRYGNKIPNSCD